MDGALAVMMFIQRPSKCRLFREPYLVPVVKRAYGGRIPEQEFVGRHESDSGGSSIDCPSGSQRALGILVATPKGVARTNVVASMG